MATADSVKNSLQQRPQGSVMESKKPRTLTDMLNSMTGEFGKALPKGFEPERFVRLGLTAVRNNPRLQDCDPVTFIAALMQSAQVGLEPNTSLGEAYLIPYNNKKKIEDKWKYVPEVQFQIGYKGILSLAQRTGEYQAIYAHEVYEGDEFRYSLGLNKDLVHIPCDNPKSEKPTHYYAVYKLKNGGFDFVVWSREKIDYHKNKFSASATSNSSPWNNHYDSMAKKTVILDVLKYAPKSIELAKAVEADSTIKREVEDDMSIVLDATDYTAEDLPLNEPKNPDPTDSEKEKESAEKEDRSQSNTGQPFDMGEIPPSDAKNPFL